MGGAVAKPTNVHDEHIVYRSELAGSGNAGDSVRSKFAQLHSKSHSAKTIKGHSVKHLNHASSEHLFRVDSSLVPSDSTKETVSKAFNHKDHVSGTNTQIEFEESMILPKFQVLELVKWLLRKSNDTKRTEDVLKIFSTCLEGGLNYEEFVFMYEGNVTLWRQTCNV
jgi:hypothetical protein